jgi:hypothetical protein
MTNDTLEAASKVLPPLAKNAVVGSPTIGQGEINLAVSGTAVRIVIPSWLAGKYAEFTASGATCDILFGGASVEVVYAQATGVAAEVATVHANTGRRVPMDQTRTWIVPVPAQAGFMSVEASGAGFLFIGVASEQIVR